MTTREIPFSLDAEESLLGNILLFPQSLREFLQEDLQSEDFYLEKNQKIYTVMLNMNERNENIDTISLGSKLKDFGLFDKIGGMEYLMNLAGKTVGASNTKEYIRIIKSKSISRQIIKAGEEISRGAADSTVPIDDIINLAKDRIDDITRHRTDNNFKSSKEVFDDAISKIEKITRAGTTITGIKSCFTDIDNTTAGFQKGDFIILAARPSVGKTAFSLNLAMNAAATCSQAVAFFSLEMPAEQLANRILAAKSKVDLSKIRTGKLTDQEWARLNDAAGQMRSQKLFIDDTAGIKVSDMYAKCRKLKNDYGLGIIFIDYIQLILGSGKAESRQVEVSEISRRLKAMARELQVPIIALSQLSRDVEKRPDKHPMLSDLRETGSLEQDADMIIFLYREDYYKKEEEKQDREDIEINIAKHRNGPTRTVKLAFEKNFNAFYSIKNGAE